jgi:hypothetical protein
MNHPGAKFKEGDLVRVADHATLSEFVQSWKLHHTLQPDQLEHAGKTTRVAEVRLYHGGDILYVLEGAPGIWHQRCVKGV